MTTTSVSAAAELRPESTHAPNDWEQDKNEARARFAHIERVGDIRALYDALIVVADTLSAFQAQPRYTSEATKQYTAAGEYLEAMQQRAEADIAVLVEIASAAVEGPLATIHRADLNRVILHWEARIGQTADEIAAIAATLAVKADRIRTAKLIAEPDDAAS